MYYMIYEDDVSVKWTKAQKAYIKKCESAAESAGVTDGVLVWATDKKDIYEDDGNLHVAMRGVHVAFGIGQDLPSAEYNEKTKAIMTAMGLAKKISERVLVDEEEDEDDEYCSHCGRGR